MWNLVSVLLFCSTQICSFRLSCSFDPLLRLFACAVCDEFVFLLPSRWDLMFYHKVRLVPCYSVPLQQFIFHLFSRLLFTICDQYKTEKLVQSKVVFISQYRALPTKKKMQPRLRCMLPNLSPNSPAQVYVAISMVKA